MKAFSPIEPSIRLQGSM